MLPPFDIVARLRPVDLVSPHSARPCPVGTLTPCPRKAPYAAVQASVSATALVEGRVELTLSSGTDTFVAWWDSVSGQVGIDITTESGGRPRTTSHVSRRHGTLRHRPDGLALTLTGTHLTLLCRSDAQWQAHARHDLGERVDVRRSEWLGALQAGAQAGAQAGGQTGGAALRDVVAGGFGQLGLRDLRLVTEADGTPVRDGDHLLLTATSAGPGFFDTAHTSLWGLHPDTLELEHRSDLFFTRPDREGAYGDHATHLVRDDNRWLVATSTWGDFEPTQRPVRVTLAESDADLLRGEHLLTSHELSLPTDGFTSVGVWDPHLLRDGETWRVGYVSARKYFVFHPVLAQGPTLDRLTLSAAATGRRATEGTTWLRVGGALRVLASDGPESARALRQRFPIFDTELNEVGQLDAPYPSNLPWPTLVETDRGWLLLTFDGTQSGGDLLGYGTHGDVVIMRER
ncbi:hypothetical protein [Nocardioides gilvus]|uniref:hypothetical protein n=1 Tax=Nocardioides gilvus TaxID=1735589 RepID=UPI000D7495D4|nr:hypothetical protein [Nocardioides gilvus]